MATPIGHKRPKTIALSFGDAVLAEAGLEAFCATAYPNLSASAAVRELVLRGLGTDPLDAAVTCARRAAYNAAVAAMRTVVARAFLDAAQKYETEAVLARSAFEDAVEERVAQRVAEELQKRGIIE